jgi:hypothetical protein
MNENDINLRDYFAGLAMRYFLENTTDRDAVLAAMEWEEMTAVQSYMMADAMMSERNTK